jgi:hypothetical protein
MKTLLIVLLSSALSTQAADVTITIPDPEVTRVLNAIASTNGYTGLNPQGGAETKAQFARRMLRNWVIAQVKIAEGEPAADAARAAVNASVDSIGVN